MALIAPVEDGTVVGTGSSSEEKKANNDLGYDQFLQLLCAEMQYQDPLEPTSNTEYVAQLATFSQMEAMLNMQNSIESSKANALVGKYVIVKTTSESTGETTSKAGFVDFIHYENGKQYLSIEGDLYSVDDVYEVADTTYIEAMSLADAFTASVLKLPDADKLTLAYEKDIEKLIGVYNGMTPYQKSFVSQQVQDKFLKLAGTMKGMVFHDELSKLPAVGEITLENKEDITSLRKFYDGLSDYEKGFISEEDYNKLKALEDKLAELGGASGETESGGGADKKE